MPVNYSALRRRAALTDISGPLLRQGHSCSILGVADPRLVVDPKGTDPNFPEEGGPFVVSCQGLRFTLSWQELNSDSGCFGHWFDLPGLSRDEVLNHFAVLGLVP